jgi:hypothetical protein
MYRRDYVMRLIEAFGQALIALRNRILKRQADSQTVLAELGEMARTAGLDLDIARQLDPSSLLMWLSPTAEYDPPRLWLLAELLYLAGLQAEADRPGSGHADFTRALALLDHVPAGWTPPGEFGSAAGLAQDIADAMPPSKGGPE